MLLLFTRFVTCFRKLINLRPFNCLLMTKSSEVKSFKIKINQLNNFFQLHENTRFIIQLSRKTEET